MPRGRVLVVDDQPTVAEFLRDALTHFGFEVEMALTRSDALALTAPGLGERAETWVLQSSPMWHLEAKGLPSSQDEQGLRYQPLPGESLHVAVTHDQVCPGPPAGRSTMTGPVETTDPAPNVR